MPSAGNAEPNSPIRRENKDSQGRIVPDVTAPGRTLETNPERDAIPGGSGGGGSRTGDPSGADPLDATETRSPTSIDEEPERIRRGGGAAGANLDECMQVWDPGTHMTKEQWRATCERLGR